MTDKTAREVCRRFEELLLKRSDLSDEELEFLLGHEDACASGIHTVDALEQLLGFSSGSLRKVRWGEPLPEHDPTVLSRMASRLRAFLDEEQVERSLIGAAVDTAQTLFTRAFLPLDLPRLAAAHFAGTRDAHTVVRRDTWDCPALQDVPGLEPHITIEFMRLGRETTVTISLEHGAGQPLPSNLRIAFELRRAAVATGQVLTFDFFDEPLVASRRLPKVGWREKWFLSLTNLQYGTDDERQDT